MTSIPSYFFNDTSTTEIYTLSLHDALPVVGLELVLYALRLEDALRAQHLLHLVLHREPVLEAPGGIGADGELTLGLVAPNLRAKRRPLARVLLERHEIARRELAH